MAPKGSLGFTLIELVMVILILGILSVGAMGLFATREDFASALVKDQLLANLRLAQQLVLARQAEGDLTLEIRPEGDSWQLRFLQNGAAAVAARTIDREGTDIYSSITEFGAPCASLTPAPVTLTFDRRGDTSQNRRICVTGEITYEICVSAAGHAYEGACIL